ncbi:MAG TPA: cation-translocating P-type ATPase [Chryseolinea sp.]|nr:cation-translocating P-type ATPase [Chryseolinea sp.]
MSYSNIHFSGLSAQQVAESRTLNGLNRIDPVQESRIKSFLKGVIQEPMLLLLIAASIVYFLHGDLAEGIFLAVAILLVSSISIYQESRSKKALDALKHITQPKAKVIRASEVMEVPSEEVVVGDYLIVDEGSLVAADGLIVQANDFTVNESVVTGESLPVYKDTTAGNNSVYQGTFVVSGLAICQVTNIGIQTKVGQIGKSLAELKAERSPLQIQITSFVAKMAGTGILVFIVIWAVSIFRTRLILDSLLQALTIAMSILPEEIPVAFATFMAIGAWRLMQLGIIVKNTRTVETLGSATVICVDKTGTITKNEMRLAAVYSHLNRRVYEKVDELAAAVIRLAMWASEPIPFDPMEKEIHEVYAKTWPKDERPLYRMVHEYPLSGNPPMMTHIFRDNEGDEIIAVKGAPEALLKHSDLTSVEREEIDHALESLSRRGYRVLAVGQGNSVLEYPASQENFKFAFKGLVAFYDPPKDNIKEVLRSFYKAGVDVKIITGDNATTTAVIAEQIELRNKGAVVTGEQLMTLSSEELSELAGKTTIFARMFPEAKLRIIEALKRKNQIVAMTGDGINDGPALKAAHIGIAMGKKGSEIAKQASSLILVDDDLGKMVTAIAMGRKIYNNLKKAIQYVISIHIPIILIVFIPHVLGWLYPTVFTPVHVIFLELVMGPTCSIIYENEPIEKNLMMQGPRPFSSTFFRLKELGLSILQGLVITAGLIAVYWKAVENGRSAQTTTAMVFVTLVTANIVLTLVNRSFYYSIIETFRYTNKLIPLIIAVTVSIVILSFAVPWLRTFFGFDVLRAADVLFCMLAGFGSVIWFEGYKFFKRKGVKKRSGVSL